MVTWYSVQTTRSDDKRLRAETYFTVQAGLILHNFFLRDFASTLLENLHHFLNLCDNFWFKEISHRQSMATLIFCRRLPRSNVTVTPSVTCTDWLRWWYNNRAHLVSSSTALAFLTSMSEKCKCTVPSAIQVKNWWKTIGTQEKLDVISQGKKGKQIVDTCHNVKACS
jgi:hypothetical protein